MKVNMIAHKKEQKLNHQASYLKTSSKTLNQASKKKHYNHKNPNIQCTLKSKPMHQNTSPTQNLDPAKYEEAHLSRVEAII